MSAVIRRKKVNVDYKKIAELLRGYRGYHPLVTDDEFPVEEKDPAQLTAYWFYYGQRELGEHDACYFTEKQVIADMAAYGMRPMTPTEAMCYGLQESEIFRGDRVIYVALGQSGTRNRGYVALSTQFRFPYTGYEGSNLFFASNFRFLCVPIEENAQEES